MSNRVYLTYCQVPAGYFDDHSMLTGEHHGGGSFCTDQGSTGFAPLYVILVYLTYYQVPAGYFAMIMAC
jgi:hypothetical protein